MSLEIGDLQAILDINQKINSIGDVRSILKDISHYAGVLLKAEGASILLMDPQTGNLHFEVAFGDNTDALFDMVVPKGKGIAGYAADTGKHVIVDDVQNDQRFYRDVDNKTQMHTKTIVAMPMINKDITIGVIEVINPESGSFSEDDIVLLRQFAEQAATAIANALLYKQLHDRANELEYLYQISNLTNTTYDKKELFQKIVLLLAKAFCSNRISLMFMNEETGKLYVESALGLPDDVISGIEVNLNIDKISSKVLTTGKVYFSNDMEKSGYGRNKKLRYLKNAFICVPIKLQNIPIGVINISEPIKGLKYSQDMIKTLQTIANQVGHAYESILSYQQKIEHEKIKKEVDIMKMLQNALLITEFSDFKNLSVFAKMKTAEIVGGDFYDVYKFSPNRIGFVVGDVSGKGLPASLYMAVSRSVIKAYAYQMNDPNKLLESANEILVDDSRVGMFVTLFYGVIDLNNKSLEYSNAGHNLQFIYKNSSKTFIPLVSKGIPLGITRMEAYRSSRIALDSGDIVICFTDGIVDAVNESGEDFGMRRLENVVRDYASTNSATLVHSIMREVDEWANNTAQWDDMTVLAMKIP